MRGYRFACFIMKPVDINLTVKSDKQFYRFFLSQPKPRLHPFAELFLQWQYCDEIFKSVIFRFREEKQVKLFFRFNSRIDIARFHDETGKTVFRHKNGLVYRLQSHFKLNITVLPFFRKNILRLKTCYDRFISKNNFTDKNR